MISSKLFDSERYHVVSIRRQKWYALTWVISPQLVVGLPPELVAKEPYYQKILGSEEAKGVAWK